MVHKSTMLQQGGGGGTVTDVTATSPITSSGGATPNISITQADTNTDGYLSQTDWDTFNNKASASFVTIAVSGQSNVVADSATDTLTLVAGTNVTITTNATTDAITINASGGGGTPAGSDGAVQFNDSGAFGADDDNFYWDKANALLGVGIDTDLEARGTFKAPQSFLAPPTGLTITPTIVPDLDYPTVVTSQITGPDDSASAGLNASQNNTSGNYFADGSTDIDYYVYAIVQVGTDTYYVGTAPTYNFVDDNSSQSFSVDLTWNPVTNATSYIIQAVGSANTGSPNWVQNVGNIYAFTDTGSNVSADPLPGLWTSIAFFPPTGPTADNPSGMSASNNPSGGYPDDGSINSIGYEIWAYGPDSNAVLYYSNSSTTAGTGPPGVGGSFSVDLSWSSGGTQSGFKILKTTNYTAGGSDTYSVDVGNVLSYNDGAPGGSVDLTVTPVVSSFSPATTRGYHSYGYETSPITYYSPSYDNYTFTDSAPASGYVVQHDLTYGTTLNAKILGQNNGQGFANSYSTTAATFYETNTGFWVGDNTVTPTQLGILSSGQTYYFKAYAKQNSPLLFSLAHEDENYTFPNDGQYRYLTLNWTVGGAANTRFLRDTGSGFNEYYNAEGINSFVNYASTPTWLSGSTVIPNAVDGIALLGVNSAVSKDDEAQIIAKSDASVGTDSMAVAFTDSGDSEWMRVGHDGVSTYGYINTKNNRLDFYGDTVGQYAYFSSNATQLNTNLSSVYTFTIRGVGGVTPLKYDENVRTLFVGYPSSLAGSGSSLSVGNNGTSPSVFISSSGTSDTGSAVTVQPTGGGAPLAVLTRDGRLNLRGSTTTTGALVLPGSSTTLGSMLFEDSASNPTIPGVLDRALSGGILRYRYSSISCRVMTNNGTNLTTNNMPLINSSGNFIDSPVSATGGLVTVASGNQLLMAGGAALGSGQNWVLGSNSVIQGNSRWNRTSKTASFTFTSTNDSPWVTLTGTTASQTATLPTAASLNGVQYGVKNNSTQNWTIATTSSQTIFTTSAVTTVTLKPGETLSVVSDGSNWVANISPTLQATSVSGGAALTKTDDTNVTLTLGGAPTTALLAATSLTLGWTGVLSQARGGTGQSTPVVVAASVSQVGTATTTFTVTIGATQANTTYKVNVTPTNLLSAAAYYVSNKTTTTFDVVYLAGLTGTVTFDWALFT